MERLLGSSGSILLSLANWEEVEISNQNSFSCQQHFLPSLQVLYPLLKLPSLPLGAHLLPSDGLQLFVRQLVDPLRRKQSHGCFRPSYQVMIHGLHADIVHKPLPSHLVVCLQNIMDIVRCVLVVAHVIMGK